MNTLMGAVVAHDATVVFTEFTIDDCGWEPSVDGQLLFSHIDGDKANVIVTIFAGHDELMLGDFKVVSAEKGQPKNLHPQEAARIASVARSWQKNLQEIAEEVFGGE